MICDKQLEFFNNQAITSEEVTSPVIKVGKTGAAEEVVAVITGNGLTGGTGIKAVVETADNEEMSDAVELASFETSAIEGKLLQFKLPFGMKEFMRVKVTPSGTFTAGTISGNCVWGPELGV